VCLSWELIELSFNKLKIINHNFLYWYVIELTSPVPEERKKRFNTYLVQNYRPMSLLIYTHADMFFYANVHMMCPAHVTSLSPYFRVWVPV